MPRSLPLQFRSAATAGLEGMIASFIIRCKQKAKHLSLPLPSGIVFFNGRIANSLRSSERARPGIGSGMTEQRMARSDVWRLQYRRDRYARHLSHAELTQRFHDLLLNLVTVTPNGIGFRPGEISPDGI